MVDVAGESGVVRVEFRAEEPANDDAVSEYQEECLVGLLVLPLWAFVHGEEGRPGVKETAVGEVGGFGSWLAA